MIRNHFDALLADATTMWSRRCDASTARAEAAEAANAAMTEREGVLRSACAPFKDMAGEMFARNWNRDQVAIALDNPGDLHRLTFGDFLDLHAAIKGTSDAG